MSQITADHANSHHEEPHVAARSRLVPELVHAPAGWGRGWAGLLLIGGVAALIVGLIGALASDGSYVARQMLAAYHTGFLFVIGLALGSMAFVMFAHLTNAGWSVSLRRQAENVMSLMPLCLALFLPVLIIESLFTGGALFKWMDADYTAGDVLYEVKRPYLNTPFWVVRAVLYFVVWCWLASTLYRISRTQDRTGDRWLTLRASRLSAPGMIAFAMTVAFASFDWMMSLDYHWFSTMFPVFFFAGSIVSTIAMLILILGAIKLSGKFGNAVTGEHFHDMGKLLLAFTAFWAYISFSQYFLIWYVNIPEETMFYNIRQMGIYRPLTAILGVGHFIVPFLILLFRHVKRTPRLLMAVSAWILLMHGLDLYLLVRPMVLEVPAGTRLVPELALLLAPVLIFAGMVIYKIGAAPLVPLKDPRLHETLEHKNYV